jgi:hypothetical protein
VLSSQWINAAGQAFWPQVVAAYDAYSSVLGINNAIIVNELKADRPLLVCNQSHAMVLVAVDYVDTPMGPNIGNAYVMDPFPGFPDIHPLTAMEIIPAHMGGQMTYLASVHI